MTGRPARTAAHAALAALGAATAAAGLLVQAAWFPLGLLLALAGTAALVWGGAFATRTRAGAAAGAGGWLLAVLVLLFASTRPEGDFLFGAGTSTYVFLLGGSFTAVICATVVPPGAVPPPGARKPDADR